MSNTIDEFVELVENRSAENQKSINLLFAQNLLGQCVSILRQEIDTFIRIVYLGRMTDLNNRERLMRQTLNGKKWTENTVNNKTRNVTDREMVELARQLKGYVQYAYKFGCAFIHLSNKHNYKKENPFEGLDFREELDIKYYLNQYHGFNRNLDLTIENVKLLIPAIFDKISSNMLYYCRELKEHGIISD